MNESERFDQLLDKVGEEVSFTLKDGSIRVIKCLPDESESQYSFSEFDLTESKVVLMTKASLIEPIENEIDLAHYLGLNYDVNIRFHFDEALIGLT